MFPVFSTCKFSDEKHSSPSSLMPTLRHFWKRQKGHLFLWVLSMPQSWFCVHVYLLLFWTVLLKKPCHDNACNKNYILTGSVSCLKTTGVQSVIILDCSKWTDQSWQSNAVCICIHDEIKKRCPCYSATIHFRTG